MEARNTQSMWCRLSLKICQSVSPFFPSRNTVLHTFFFPRTPLLPNWTANTKTYLESRCNSAPFQTKKIFVSSKLNYLWILKMELQKTIFQKINFSTIDLHVWSCSSKLQRAFRYLPQLPGKGPSNSCAINLRICGCQNNVNTINWFTISREHISTVPLGSISHRLDILTIQSTVKKTVHYSSTPEVW